MSTDAVPSHDKATGRVAFLKAIQAPQAPVDGAVRAAMLVRIDQFDVLEERMGFIEAQQAAGRVVDAVRSRMGPQDSLFLFSDSEVAVLAQRTSAAGIEQLGDLLRDEIGGMGVGAQSQETQVTVTVTALPLDAGEGPESVVRQLVTMAREISEKGGHRFVMLGATAEAIRMEREEARRAEQIRTALQDNRLTLANEAITSLDGSVRSHSDVVLCMLDEDGRELRASEFLGAARKFKLITVLDRWVVAHAIETVVNRPGGNRGSSLFVKLSEETLCDADDFGAWLNASIKSRDIALKPGDIVFQFEELAVQNHYSQAKVLYRALRAAGAGLAVEHFGVYAQSALLLDELPVSFIRFHPSLPTSAADGELQKKLNALVEIAKRKGIKTIVPHVDDSSAMARLWQMGVNFVQGHHVQQLLAEDKTVKLR